MLQCGMMTPMPQDGLNDTVSTINCVPFQPTSICACAGLPGMVALHQVDPDVSWRAKDVEHLVFPFCWGGISWIVLRPFSHSVPHVLRV